MSDFDEAVAHNRAAWDKQVDEGSEWSQPFGPEVIAAARQGDLSSVVLIGHKTIPRDWLPADLRGVDILALASGGGQQAPVLAAAGANVTVLDNSPKQLERDRLVAQREGLAVRTELGDMRDLSRFEDASFDLVLNPVSNLFCPELDPVWRECYRVLRPGGSLLVGFMNPDQYIFDAEAMETRNEFVVRHSLPYSDLTSLPAEERERLWDPEAPFEFSHSLGEQIGGQIAASFVITGFDEAPHHALPTREYMPGYFATRGLKLPR